MDRPRRFVNFLKTTAVGGLFFLLPLIVLGALIGQVVPIVMTVANTLYGFLPFKTPAGIALLILLAIGIIILLCFVSGLIARRSFAKRISKWFEKKISLMFPRYNIIKEQMKGTIGGDELQPTMKPVLIRMQDCHRVGFEIEAVDQVHRVVYLPGSPDAWSGSVAIVEAHQLQPIDVEFGDAVGISEQLGRGASKYVSGYLAATESAD